jgi:hypothetical protein
MRVALELLTAQHLREREREGERERKREKEREREREFSCRV